MCHIQHQHTHTQRERRAHEHAQRRRCANVRSLTWESKQKSYVVQFLIAAPVARGLYGFAGSYECLWCLVEERVSRFGAHNMVVVVVFFGQCAAIALLFWCRRSILVFVLRRNRKSQRQQHDDYSGMETQLTMRHTYNAIVSKLLARLSISGSFFLCIPVGPLLRRCYRSAISFHIVALMSSMVAMLLWSCFIWFINCD